MAGVVFGVWAPSAERVSVIGDFNGWDREAAPLSPRGDSGIWEGFVPEVSVGDVYKFGVVGPNGYQVDKADPLAVRAEVPPKTGSIVWDLSYDWGDEAWMSSRGGRHGVDAPISVYEVHLGSWRRDPSDPGRLLSYREVAPMLAEHALSLGYTHVELLPIMEHPFYGSWGYQTTGYFAATSRYGTPQDLMFLIDHLHQHGIGVLLDWVPSHFPSDEHALAFFDGTHLYEHADPREGFHPDWNSYIFNYGRHEVRSFLLSSAMFWLERYHADGIRVDAVASMLYRDYSRKAGEWIPNRFGGRENLEAIDLLRRLNEEVYSRFPDAVTVAEESTAWPMVSRPTYVGGFGFGFGRFGWGSPFYHSRFGWGGGYAWGWDDPFWYGGGVDSYVEYHSQIDLHIRATGTNAPLFDGRAQARSETNRLDVVIPSLVDAMFTGFPGRNGEVVKITIPTKPAGQAAHY